MTTHFDSLAIRDGWGHVGPDGFQFDDDPRTPGIEFSICDIDSVAIAVFVNLDAHVRAELAGRRPDWIAAVVFVDVVGCTEQLAELDATLASGTAELPRSAAAAACAAFSAGALSIEPALYRVRLATMRIDVILTFDWASESWAATTTLDGG